jgi:hypothetical protein
MSNRFGHASSALPFCSAYNFGPCYLDYIYDYIYFFCQLFLKIKIERLFRYIIGNKLRYTTYKRKEYITGKENHTKNEIIQAFVGHVLID